VNEEDLEAWLAGWRPAEPPPNLLRRLRAAEPPVRAKRFWSWRPGLAPEWLPPRSLAFAALLMSAVLALAVWQISLSPFSKPAGRPFSARIGDTHGPAFDLGSFGQAGLRYAVLDAGLNNHSATLFRLDAPAGPVRLDCGYTVPGNGLNHACIDGFTLNVRDPF
jgi:hypothetical protein